MFVIMYVITQPLFLNKEEKKKKEQRFLAWKYGREFGARRFNRPSWLKFLDSIERKKAERAGSGQEADAAARSDEVSGFRSLPRGNVL